MEVETVAEVTAQREKKPPKYDDARRKKEILPPPEEWPAAIRPAIKGRVKILEDRPLTGHRVILAKGRTEEKRAETSTAAREPKAERSGAELLLEQLTPLLKQWLEENLGSRGLSKRPDAGKETMANAGRRQAAGSNPGLKKEKPVRPQTGGAKGAREKVVQSTVVPNKALWSEVVGGRPKRTSPLTERRQPGVGTKEADVSKKENAEEWQTVAKKTKAKKPASSKSTKTPKQGEVGSPSGGKRPAREGNRKNATDPSPRGTTSGDKRAPKRRPPRTAAVTLTCPPDGYAEAMRVAQGAIDLKELGIKELRPKRAATGAIVLEVPGPNGAERAAVLKSRMEEALKNMEGVRVARPVKMADMRVRDLLASVSVEEVKGAISSVGDCPPHEIRAGEIRTAPSGLGTLWVQCPLRAANKVVAAGRLGIGWTSSRIEILEPRALQCYRCLGKGHVQSACPSSIDRSGMCYRCSEMGHAAKTCANDPRCVLCEELGLASGHRVGGRACKAPKRKPKVLRTAVTSSIEKMEVEVALPATRGGMRKNANPVPARRSREKEESEMEVEMNPGSQQTPSLGRISPRIEGGVEEPTNRPLSSPLKE